MIDGKQTLRDEVGSRWTKRSLDGTTGQKPDLDCVEGTFLLLNAESLFDPAITGGDCRDDIRMVCLLKREAMWLAVIPLAGSFSHHSLSSVVLLPAARS